MSPTFRFLESEDFLIVFESKGSYSLHNRFEENFSTIGRGVGASPDKNYSFGVQRYANSFSRQRGPILFDIDLRVVGGVTRPDLHMRCKLVLRGLANKGFGALISL